MIITSIIIITIVCRYLLLTLSNKIKHIYNIYTMLLVLREVGGGGMEPLIFFLNITRTSFNYILTYRTLKYSEMHIFLHFTIPLPI